MVHPGANEIAVLARHTWNCALPKLKHAPGIRYSPYSPALGSWRAHWSRRGWLSVHDGSHLLDEARQALLLQRVSGNPAGLTAKEAFWLATRAGAATLGRDDIGYLAPGMAADFIGYRLDTLDLAGGAVHDPLASLVFCHPPKVDVSVINGQIRVQDQQLLGVDLPILIERHNAIARALASG